MVKKLMSCVWPGVEETLASAFLPVSILSREDLPTFDLPMKANSRIPEAGHRARLAALVLKSADFISMVDG